MLLVIHTVADATVENKGSGEGACGAWVIAAAGLAKPYPQGRDCAWRACIGADVPACGGNVLEHDPEKWDPVFGKDHAQAKR
jgi:hypothetical protein